MVSRSFVRAGALAGSALVLLFAASGCFPKTGTTTPTAEAQPQEPDASQPPKPIGPPLYTAQAYRPTPVPTGAHADPVVIRGATVTLSERLEVSSEVDGELWVIGTELKLKPGDPQPSEDKIWVHPRTKARYKRLTEGDVVEAGQVVALINDERVWVRWNGMREIKPYTVDMVALGKRISEAGRKMLAIEEELRKTGPGASLREYLETEFGTLRGEMDHLDKTVNALNTTAQMDEMYVQLKQHEIHTSIPGIIKHIRKVAGSTVRATGQTDVILEIENPDRLAIEGQVGVQYTQFLNRGMRVEIEPEQQVGHLKDLPAHNAEITAITVGRGPGGKPVIVTASTDRTIYVQDRSGTMLARLRPQPPVVTRALACTMTGTSLLAAASADGKVRVWDLATINTNQAPREMKLPHRGPASAVAFSPDGKFAASGDDQSIWLWNVATGEREYELPAQHRGPITMLQFTPQCKLISVGRDNTLLIWKLGQQGAELEQASLEGRSGAVPFLGASPDGQQILFDQNNKTLRLLTLPEKRLAATLEAPESNAFANFALFSPDGKFILAGGTTAGRLQLWQAPGLGNRARAVRQFVCETPAKIPYNITIAAFAPDGSFAVAGTREGDALVLPLPAGADFNKPLPATLTLIDQDLTDTSGKQSRVKAELLANPAMRLAAGDRVTIVATPVTNGQ